MKISGKFRKLFIKSNVTDFIYSSHVFESSLIHLQPVYCKQNKQLNYSWVWRLKVYIYIFCTYCDEIEAKSENLRISRDCFLKVDFLSSKLDLVKRRTDYIAFSITIFTIKSLSERFQPSSKDRPTAWPKTPKRSWHRQKKALSIWFSVSSPPSEEKNWIDLKPSL